MIITQARLRGFKEFITGYRLVFFVKKEGLSDDTMLSIIQSNGTDGWLTFSKDKLKEEVEKVMKDRKIGASEEGRSKSEIMRGILYKYWEITKGNKNFEDFYAEKMDGFITKIKQIIAQIEAEEICQFYDKSNPGLNNPDK